MPIRCTISRAMVSPRLPQQHWVKMVTIRLRGRPSIPSWPAP